MTATAPQQKITYTSTNVDMDGFHRAFDAALAEAVVKAEILNTDGVAKIEGISVTFDRKTRDLRYRGIQVRTDDDVRLAINA